MDHLLNFGCNLIRTALPFLRRDRQEARSGHAHRSRVPSCASIFEALQNGVLIVQRCHFLFVILFVLIRVHSWLTLLRALQRLELRTQRRQRQLQRMDHLLNFGCNLTRTALPFSRRDRPEARAVMRVYL